MGMRVIDEDTKKEFYLSDDKIEIVGQALQEMLKSKEDAFNECEDDDLHTITEKDFGIPEVKKLISDFMGEE